MIKPIDKNFGLHPSDPEYDDDFDYEALIDQYELEMEMERDERLAERNEK